MPKDDSGFRVRPPEYLSTRPARRSGPTHVMAGLALAQLFRSASILGDVHRIVEAYPAPETSVRAALSWLVAEGFLMVAGSRRASP